MSDSVNHPSHYTSNSSGIETIQITERLGFCLGNSVKYISRANHKWNRLEDLKKSIWYINREASQTQNNTSNIRELLQDELRFVDGVDASPTLKLALVMILQSYFGSTKNTGALYEAIRLIEEEIAHV